MSNDNDHDNDSDHGAVATAPSGGAIAALAKLGEMLNSTALTSISGYSGRPMLMFKAHENTYSFGLAPTIPEEDSLWAVNPLSFQHGFVCFNDNNKRAVPCAYQPAEA